MSRGGYEVILGSKKDPTFGPAMMFGMGGTGVELYRDVAVDFPPLNQALAQSHDPEHQGQPAARAATAARRRSTWSRSSRRW